MPSIVAKILVVLTAAIVGVLVANLLSKSSAAVSMPAAAVVDAGSPEASLAPTVAASAMPPEYHAGDYKLLLPQGSIVLPGPDGGTTRYHDGQEHPCSYGCLAMYNGAVQQLTSKGVRVTDTDAVVADVRACILACQVGGADKIFWPPISK